MMTSLLDTDEKSVVIQMDNYGYLSVEQIKGW